MRFPKSGRFSNQLSGCRRFTTSPKIATAGASKETASALSAMSASVPTSVFWWPVLAQRTRATGVLTGIPSSRSRPVMDRNRSMPMSMTLVPGEVASAL